MGRARRLHWMQLDQVVAVLILASIEVHVWTARAVPDRLVPALGGLVFAGPVAFRRRWPILAAGVIDVLLIVRSAVGGSQGVMHTAVGVLPALLLIMYGLGRYAPPGQSVWVLGVTVVLAAVNVFATGQGMRGLVPATVVIAGLPYATGLGVRVRAERAAVERVRSEQADVLSDMSALAARYRERTRVARELHDVVAHSVSVMVIQAGGARMVMDTDPDRAEASLLSVERAGREALAEMRRLLELFDHVSWREPRPGLADIESLVDRARSSGLTATVSVWGAPSELSPALDLCAYRVIQEALTNVIKHAAPARATVSLRWRVNELEIEVTDDGAGTGASLGTGGHGIAGMRERVAVHGGTVVAQPAPGGGFRVLARMPLAAEPVP